MLYDISFSSIFLDMSPQAYKHGNKRKNKQMKVHQTKNFCTSKETINKMKRQPTEWEEIFAINMSKNGLISKI